MAKEPGTPLGRLLRELRLEKKLKMKQFAEHADIDVDTYALIESGDTPNPRVATLTRLADALRAIGYGEDVIQSMYEAARA